MTKSLIVLLLIILFLSACSTPPSAVDEATQVGEITVYTPPAENATPTPIQLQVQDRTNPEPIVLATVTTAPPITPTNNSIPETNRWHWVFNPDSSEILVVNQSGDVHSIGEIDLAGNYNYRLLPVSDHQVLLFTFSQKKPVVFLFDLKEIQTIKLPASFYYDENMLINSLEVVGVSDHNAYFIFSTEQSSQTDRNTYPEKGPIYKIDLVSKEVNLVDEKVYHEPSYDNRLLFLQSKDGLFTRYFKASNNDLLVRELNLNTGEVRTITSSTGSPNRVNSSIHGEIFHLTVSNVFVEVGGKSVNVTGSESELRLLRGGEAVLSSGDCQGPCDIEIIEPMTNKILANYTLPWVAQSFFRLGTQFLPNQNMLWIGASSSQLLEPPATQSDFPELDDFDHPVFLLGDQKQEELIGIFPNEFFDFFQYPISDDGRYILLKSSTGSHYFIYDAFENLELFSLPIEEGWDYFYGDVSFFEEGILIHFLASNPDKEYKDFYSMHQFGQSGSVYWEDQEGSILSCPDLFSDGTLACWFQNPDLYYDLVRFNPTDQTKVQLVENIEVLESTY